MREAELNTVHIEMSLVDAHAKVSGAFLHSAYVVDDKQHLLGLISQISLARAMADGQHYGIKDLMTKVTCLGRSK